MKNSLVLLAVVLSVAAFAGMMRIKTDVQTMDRERMKLVVERSQLRETKRVLEAEWALLASPEHLERLVRGRGYIGASALDVVTLSGTPVSATTIARSVSASVIVSRAELAVSATPVTVSGAAPAEASATTVAVSATKAE